jgi:small subunit ribosomal protein S15
MICSKNALLVVLALCANGVSAFSPASPSSVSVAQMVQDTQRYQPPRTTLGGALDEELNDIDSPPADDYIVNVGELEADDDEDAGTEDDGEVPSWAASQARVEENREKYRRSENDTGSPEFQVAGMTERISYLTRHLQENPKDYSTRRGLVALVNKRRRLLNYLVREDEQRYKEIISGLGIRHRAPSTVESRDIKYGRFNKQKAIKKHLIKKRI